MASSWAGDTDVTAATNARMKPTPEPLKCRGDAEGFWICGFRDSEEYTGSLKSVCIDGTVVL